MGKEEYKVCANCQGNPWLVKRIPRRGTTVYPCPFCNAEKPHRPPLDIRKEELERMKENFQKEACNENP